jgi:hypothetical protein
MPNNLASESAREIDRWLLSYSGPDAERVRRAIAKLARDDPKKAEHFAARAAQDYRDVLWWADVQDEVDRKKQLLAAMSLSDRLAFLKLSEEWTTAVTRGNRQGAGAILQKCDLPEAERRKIIATYFASPPGSPESAPG